MTSREADPQIVNFVIQVKDREAIESIATSLAAQGLHVDRILHTVGVIGGHGPLELKKRLGEITGVGIVREEGFVQLPPFDERVPQ